MAAAQLTAPTGTTSGPAAGSVVSTLQRTEKEQSPALALDLRLQAIARCWGA
jgi:hypothetical protein